MASNPRFIKHEACAGCNKEYDTLLLYERGGRWWCSSCNKNYSEALGNCGGCGKKIEGKWVKPLGASSKYHPDCATAEKSGSSSVSISKTEKVKVSEDAPEAEKFAASVRPVKNSDMQRLTGVLDEVTPGGGGGGGDSEESVSHVPKYTASSGGASKPTVQFCPECGAKRESQASKFCAECGAAAF